MVAGRGFSLIETAIVVAIIGIAAAIAVPRYAAAVWRYRADLVAQRVSQDFSFARSVARQVSGSISVSFSGSAYQINGAASLDRSGTYATDVAADPYRARISSVLFGGSATTLTFNGFGIPQAAGGVVLAVGGLSRRVDVDSAGQISIRTP